MSSQLAEIRPLLEDKYWRLNNLYYIINESGDRVQFRFNPVQERLYQEMWYFNVVLKSRQHGMTTFFCLYSLDECLFNANYRAGIIAHTREDAEYFFSDKIKYAYDNLPDFLQAIQPARSDSARELTFRNNSKIRVGVSMRGATLQFLHISEFGKICAKYPDKAREIITGSLDTVHVGQLVSIESTAEGNEGRFFEICSEAKKIKDSNGHLTPLSFRYHFYAWWEDERNRLDPVGVAVPPSLDEYFMELFSKHNINLTPEQKAWYAEKWVTQGKDMKREHPSFPKEAFEASIEGAYFSTQFNRIYKDGRITTVPHEHDVKVDTCWDLGIRQTDTTAIWFFQRVGQEVRWIDFYENHGEGLGHYASILDKRGYRYGNHYAPHDIKVRELGPGKSRLQQARKYGLFFKVAPKYNKSDQIEAARGLLGVSWFDEKKCADGIKALENYRKQWDDKTGTYKSTPLHSWASNPADSFQVAAVCHRVPGGGQTTYIPRRKKKFRRRR